MGNKLFAALGLSDLKSFLFKYFLPILVVDIIILLIFLFAFESQLLRGLGIVIFFGVIWVSFMYPMMIVDNQSRKIEESMHYFITYAGALSTVNLDRKDFFIDLSEKNRYKEISQVFKRLIYLVQSIKVDFATASYKLASIIKTEHFSRFLERMGIALSFGADISKFFLDEQRVLMDAYSVVYKEGLERIRFIQEMFTSLVLAFAFVLATILLIPFLSGDDPALYLLFGLFGIVILDAILLMFAGAFLPKDNLYHDMGYDEGRKKVVFFFFISTVLALLLVPITLFLDFSMMVKLAIISTPFLIVGFYSNYQEKLVIKRDMVFPAFIRSLGDVHQAKGGTLTTTMETLLPHNFGILNPMIEKVYKRLKITSDKFNSWYFFCKESGSTLIAEFMDIFTSVVYRGGSSQIAGQIASDNMSRINGLRDMKKEFSSTLKGAIYGSFFGLGLTLYVSLLISMLLIRIFTSLTAGVDPSALDLIGDIFPSTDPDQGAQSAGIFIALILAVHAIFSGYILKKVDGGNVFSMATTVVFLLWFGVIIETSVTFVFEGMFSSYFGGGEVAIVDGEEIG